MRRVAVALLLVGGAIALWLQRAEAAAVTAALAHARPGWLALGLLCQVGFWAATVALHRAAFAAIGVSWGGERLTRAWFRSLLVNLSLPGAGASALLIDAVREGIAPAGAASALLLARVADLTTLTALVAVGLAILAARGLVRPTETLAALGLAGLVGLWGGGLLLARRAPAVLARLLTGVERLSRGRLPGGWGAAQARHAAEGAAPLFDHPRRLLAPLAFALVAHALDLLCLGVLTRAFGLHVGPAALLAAFALGLLFWNVAVTPDGLGAVEGMMSVVLVSLGAPRAPAVAAVLAFRGLALWLPVGVGALWQAARLRLSERLAVKLVAAATAVMGAVNLVSATLPSLALRRPWLWSHLPLEVRHGSRLATALASFALLLLAQGLLRRKAVALRLTVAALALSAVGHVAKGLDWEEAALSVALLAALWRLRGSFVARSDGPTLQQGVKALAAALGFTLAYGVVGLWLLDSHFSEDFGLRGALAQTLAMFFSFQDHGLVPRTRFGLWFADSIYLVAGGTLLFALVSALRPVLLRQSATPAERHRARTIVERYGRSSLARFVLLSDKLYWFSPGGSVVGYALAGRTAVALGDPIGPAEDAAAAIAGYVGFCRANDWDPALYQTLPDHLDAYRDAGLEAVCIGGEAVVPLAGFSLAGGERKSLRHRVAKARSAGWTTRVLAPPHPPELLRRLRTISDDWLRQRHGGEKRFSLGWFDDDYLSDGPVIVAYGPDGDAAAFANLVPEYARNELTLDLMRQRRDIDAGVMDLLLVDLMLWAREQGYESFNLGLAPLAGVGERRGDPPVERALNLVYRRGGRFYGFEGLRAYKEKFRPEWQPRYLVYGGRATLPRAAAAVVRADNPALLAHVAGALRRASPAG